MIYATYQKSMIFEPHLAPIADTCYDLKIAYLNLMQEIGNADQKVNRFTIFIF
jgi:hypothetical protein